MYKERLLVKKLITIFGLMVISSTCFAVLPGEKVGFLNCLDGKGNLIFRGVITHSLGIDKGVELNHNTGGFFVSARVYRALATTRNKVYEITDNKFSTYLTPEDYQAEKEYLDSCGLYLPLYIYSPEQKYTTFFCSSGSVTELSDDPHIQKGQILKLDGQPGWLDREDATCGVLTS